MPYHRGNLNLALTFLFVGLGTGALVALLLAPKTGRQMRRTLKRRYEDARDAFEDLSEQAGEAIDKGAGWANAAARTAKEAVAPLGRVINNVR